MIIKRITVTIKPELFFNGASLMASMEVSVVDKHTGEIYQSKEACPQDHIASMLDILLARAGSELKQLIGKQVEIRSSNVQKAGV